MTTVAGTTVVGRVDHCNERGADLAGEHDWPNISKIAAGCVDPQQFDSRDVTLTLDPQGYIREISEASPDPAPAANAEPMPAEAPVTAGTRSSRATSWTGN